jgi:hypothetical protein
MLCTSTVLISKVSIAFFHSPSTATTTKWSQDSDGNKAIIKRSVYIHRGRRRTKTSKTLFVLTAFKHDDAHFEDCLADLHVFLSLLSGPGFEDISTHIFKSVLKGFVGSIRLV